MKSLEDLEKDLQKGSLENLYLLYGEERFLLESSLKKIEKLFGEKIIGINYILKDETNINEIISDIETPAFGYEKKLIIAKNVGLFKKDAKRKTKNVDSDLKQKIGQYIKENIETIKQTVILVFVEETAEKCELLDIFDKYGIVCNFQYLKPYKIQARLKAIAKGYKVNIDDDTTNYLIESCGTNMQELINELRKLIEYAGENGTIEKNDVDKLAIKKIDSIIFDLTDNLGKKDVKKAIDVLRNLIYSKEPVQKILITLYNHFKKIYITKIALNYNKDVLQSLDLKPNQTFLVNKYKTQARYFSEKELRKLLTEFCNLDYNYKKGLIDLQIGLESILCCYI